jgi:predicted HicB family RNase H-like nuclease
MKPPARKPLDFSLTEPPAVVAAAQGAGATTAPRPVAKGEALKQLNTRIPASTHRAFKIAALQEGLSVQDLLARLIERHLTGN